MPVVVSSLFETGVGLAAALACAAALPDVPGWPAAERDHGLATADLLETTCWVPARRGGWADAGARRPAQRGLGVAVDDAVVRWYEVADA